MATHSNVLAWRIPEMGEPGGLLSVESHRVGHDWSDLAAAAAEIKSLLLHILIVLTVVGLLNSCSSAYSVKWYVASLFGPDD